MTTFRRPARGFSTWRTGLTSIIPIFAAQLNARRTAVMAPRLPRPQPGWASTHCCMWIGFNRPTGRGGESSWRTTGDNRGTGRTSARRGASGTGRGIPRGPIPRSRGRRFRLISTLGHQVVIAAERLVAVGAEVDLAAVDLDVP